MTEQTTGWQPIETAPKDGTSILAYPHYVVTHWAGPDEAMSVDGCFTGRWDDDFQAYWCVRNLTHWMHLPSPPEPKGDA